MSCSTVQLRTDLAPGSDAGGIWTYVSGGSFTTDVTGEGSVNFSNGLTPVPGGDDPELSLTGIPIGTYVFRYGGGVDACFVQADFTLNILDDGAFIAGADVHLCNSDTNWYIIKDWFSTFLPGADASEEWIIPAAIDNATNYDEGVVGDPSDDQIKPVGLAATTYQVTLRVTPAGTGIIGCCSTPQDYTLNLIVEDVFNPGTPATKSAC